MSAVATVTTCAVCCVLGDEEVDEQIRLRDGVIFHLKQQMATQQQRIEELGIIAHVAAFNDVYCIALVTRLQRAFKIANSTFLMCT